MQSYVTCKIVYCKQLKQCICHYRVQSTFMAQNCVPFSILQWASYNMYSTQANS